MLFFLCVLYFFISYLHDFFKFYKAGSSCIYNHMVLILHVELLDIIIFVNHVSARECVCFCMYARKYFMLHVYFFIFLKVPNCIIFV